MSQEKQPRIKRILTFLEKPRKHLVENLGLVIATLAAISAGWSGWEAHKTRVEAGQAAHQSLNLQDKSVDAQIEAMRLDQRPFVSVQPTSLDIRHSINNRGTTVRINYKVTAAGKTPAFNIEVGDTCAENSKKLDIADVPWQGLVSPLLLNDSLAGYCDAAVNTSNAPVRVVGYVTYIDYFKISHKTEFCYVGQLTADANRHSPISHFSNCGLNLESN